EDRATRSSASIQETYAEDFSRLLRVDGEAKRKEHGAKCKWENAHADHRPLTTRHSHCFSSRLSPHGSRLSDYPIRSRQHIGRDRQVNLLSGFQIYDELKLLRLLDGKISWLSTFENLIDICSGSPGQVRTVRSIGHETPVFYKFCRVVYCREPAL